MENILDSSIANRNLLEDYSNVTSTRDTPTTKPVAYTQLASKPKPTSTTTKPVGTVGTPVSTAGIPSSMSTSTPRPLPAEAPVTTMSDSGTMYPSSTAPSVTMGGGGGASVSEEQKGAEGTTGLVASKMIFGQEPRVVYTTVGLAIAGAIAGYFTAKKMSKSTTMFSIVGAVAGASVGFVTTKYIFTNKGEKKSSFSALNYPKKEVYSNLNYPKTKSDLHYPKTKSELNYPRTKSDLHYPKAK